MSNTAQQWPLRLSIAMSAAFTMQFKVTKETREPAIPLSYRLNSQANSIRNRLLIGLFPTVLTCSRIWSNDIFKAKLLASQSLMSQADRDIQRLACPSE